MADAVLECRTKWDEASSCPPVPGLRGSCHGRRPTQQAWVGMQREKCCRASRYTAPRKRERCQPALRTGRRDASPAAPAAVPAEEPTPGWGGTRDGSIPATCFFTTNFCATK